jgi:cytochrome c peroxidase
LTLLVVVVGTACTASAPSASFNEQEWALIASLELPDAPPADPTNPWAENDAAARLGQQLFFDRGLAGGDAGVLQVQEADGGTHVTPLTGGAGVSCADCHSPLAWFSDARTPREVSTGLGLTARNSPGLVDVANYQLFAWDGRGETLANQCIIAYVGGKTMAGTPLLAGRRLRDVPQYRAAYQALFGDSVLDTLDVATSEQLSVLVRNVSYALAAYLRRLQSHDAPFDRFVRGDASALSAAQQRGLKLFIGNAGCIECHSGPTFTDSQMHVTGVGQTSPGAPMTDLGRADGLKFLATFPWRLSAPPAPTPADVGAFRTKSLRHVAETGPYFHAGQYASLREVIWFYTRGGDHAGAGPSSLFMQPLGLSDDQQADLEAFLHALSGVPPDDALRCDASAASLGLQPDGGVGPRARTFPVCPELTP